VGPAVLERATKSTVLMADRAVSLVHRRAIYAVLALFTTVGVLSLAIVAVPPRSAGAVMFLVLFAVTLPWSVVGFLNASIGFLIMRLARDPVAAVNPAVARIRGDEPVIASTAVLMCIRNESPDNVVRNLEPMLQGLVSANVAHLFHVYVLSDTDIPEVAAAEDSCFGALAAKWGEAVTITYRRRAVNTAFKSGNIRDFCDNWGANHEFALTLDADSFMPAAAVLRLVRIMQGTPKLGILQTLIVGLPSMSPFARLFQFGMRLGMRSYTLGGAWWQGDCGPYWGHNAILRLEPFIAHCHIPKLQSAGPLGGYVLSHDQIEAALMRRAGYEVRVIPEEGLSFEDNPTTILEFLRRDLRWCHGNMQYWYLLGLPGLRPVSRFQIVFAILMYLGSPAWMTMIATGMLAIMISGVPTGPAESSGPATLGPGVALFAIMTLMIFAPKISSIVDVLLRPRERRAYGGAATFVANAVGELMFSFLLAPVMSFAHTLFMFRLFILRHSGTWSGQMRGIHAVSWRSAVTTFWPQSLAGLTVIGLVWATTPGGLRYALTAVGALALAVPFAVATASPSIGAMLARVGVGRIPEETEPPGVLLDLRLAAVAASAPAAPKQT
jgi:membrane glycosyltransferase